MNPYRYRQSFIDRSLEIDTCEEDRCEEPPVPLEEGRRIVLWSIPPVTGGMVGDCRYARHCRTHHERRHRRLTYVIPHTMSYWLEDNEVDNPPALQRVIPPPADAYP